VTLGVAPGQSEFDWFQLEFKGDTQRLTLQLQGCRPARRPDSIWMRIHRRRSFKVPVEATKPTAAIQRHRGALSISSSGVFAVAVRR